MVLEESRAAILQTLFEIFRDMERSFTSGELDRRFDKSMQNLESLANFQPQYGRERASLAFLKVYLRREKELKVLVQALFRDLGEKTIDNFLLSLSEEEVKAFYRSMRETDEDFAQRPERAMALQVFQASNSPRYWTQI